MNVRLVFAYHGRRVLWLGTLAADLSSRVEPASFEPSYYDRAGQNPSHPQIRARVEDE